MSDNNAETSRNASKKPRGQHGGPRPNSGRPTGEMAKLRADINAATAETLTEWLPGLLENMKRLADGGYERVKEKFERDEYGEMMLIERTVEIADADRGANEYLINRLLGKPTERKEVSGPDGGSLSVSLESAIEKIYGSDDE